MTKDRPDPKRYQTQAERVIAEEGGDIALVCVVGGKRGEGFSVAVKNPENIYGVPHLLRLIAARMENEAPLSTGVTVQPKIDPLTGKAWS